MEDGDGGPRDLLAVEDFAEGGCGASSPPTDVVEPGRHRGRMWPWQDFVKRGCAPSRAPVALRHG